NGSGVGSTLDVDSGTTANKIVKLDGSARLPAVDGTQLTALNVVVDTTPQLGGDLDVNGQSIVSASAGNIAITPDTTGSIVLDGLSWPQADGTTGQVLKTDGAGNLGWVTAAGGLSAVVDDTTPQLGGPLDVNGQAIVSASAGNIAITPDTTGSIVLDGQNWPQADGTTGQVLSTNGAGQLSWTTPTTGLQDVVDDTTPQLGGPLDVNGQSIVSVSAGNIAITPDTTGSIVLDGLNWPQVDGTTGQVLKTDGAGNLGWVTAAGGLSAVVDDTTPQLGGALDVNGQSIVSASAGNIAITPDTTGSIVLDGQNWPQADGTTGQVLQTNGAGQLSWTTPTTGLQDVVDDTTPQLGGPLDVNGQSIVSASAGNIAITPDTTGSIVLDGLSWPQADGTTGQVIQTNGAGQLSFVDQSGLQDVVDDTTPQLGGPLDVNGQSIVSASAGNIAITPDTTGSIVLDGQNWPQADGTSGQYLSTNGSGQLSWVTAAGASRPTVYSVSANTTIGADTAIGSGELERIYIVNTGSAVTMTLPQITGNVGNGYKLNIKRDGTNTATITPNAADNIDGGTDGASITLDVDKASFTLVCDGTNWQII
ncbi:MAG: beta strand repeat-containing protein, partial [Candidatus Nanopelagicaceae bacterium]